MYYIPIPNNVTVARERHLEKRRQKLNENNVQSF